MHQLVNCGALHNQQIFQGDNANIKHCQLNRENKTTYITYLLKLQKYYWTDNEI